MKTRTWIWVLLILVVLPSAVGVIINPLYLKLPSWLFIGLFVVVLPFLCTLLATMFSNRKMGFRTDLSTVAKQHAYYDIAYYLLFIGLSLVVLYLVLNWL